MPDAPDAAGRTPLALALGDYEHPKLACIEMLLAAGATPDVVASSGPRGAPSPAPLVLVSRWFESKDAVFGDALAALLRAGASPDAADPKGWTALHEATYRRLDGAITLLRDAHARTDLATTGRVRHYRAGTTAADVALDRARE